MTSSEAFSPIRLLRACRGVAQADLAAAIGSSPTVVSNLEAGRRPPTEDMLKRVAVALDCPVEAVAGGDFTVIARSGRIEVTAQD